MGIITILCPRTGKQVSTGVEIDRARFDRLRESRFTMTCWLCGHEHEWSKRWANFVEDFKEDGGTYRFGPHRPAHDPRRPAKPAAAKGRWTSADDVGFGAKGR
jgi:hypothetical protein